MRKVIRTLFSREPVSQNPAADPAPTLNHQQSGNEIECQDKQHHPDDQPIQLSFLIVDGSNTITALIKSYMEVLKHSVAQAFNDTEALESVRDSIENGAPYDAVLIAAFMPFGETVISGETVAMRLRQIDYSGQVIVWNSDKPACTRIDKPDCLESIENVVEGI